MINERARFSLVGRYLMRRRLKRVAGHLESGLSFPYLGAERRQALQTGMEGLGEILSFVSGRNGTEKFWGGLQKVESGRAEVEAIYLENGYGPFDVSAREMLLSIDKNMQRLFNEALMAWPNKEEKAEDRVHLALQFAMYSVRVDQDSVGRHTEAGAALRHLCKPFSRRSVRQKDFDRAIKLANATFERQQQPRYSANQPVYQNALATLQGALRIA